MKNGKLKKLITLATVVASTFALVACGSSSFTVNKAARSYIGKYLIINSQFIALPLSHDF